MLQLQVKMLLAGLLVVMVLGDAWSMDVYRMSVEEEIKINEKMRSKSPQAVKFSFAKHFQDHMVLQGGPAKATVYGFAPESAIGQQVTVELSGSTFSASSYQTKVVESAVPGAGQWLVTLDPMPMGASGTIKAKLQGSSLTLNDVIVGDVWICSGQSNMQFTVIMMLKAEEEIAEAHNYPDIRLMTVAMKDSTTPQYDLIEIEEPWSAPTNKTVGGTAWSYFSAVCWLFGKGIHKDQDIPIGLVATDWGGTPVEAWSSPDSLAECGVKESSPAYISPSYKKYTESLPEKDRYRLLGPDDNSVLYNAMIHPLLNMTIKGAIWYQGEADADHGKKMNNYNCTFPGMIKDWRKKFNMGSGGQTDPTFPFGFVQLAAYEPGANRTVGWPDIRWHQTADWGYVPNKDMPNVFMANAMDLPDFNSTYGAVHPRDKTDVGIRLTASGLAVAYKQNSSWNNYQGPFPKEGMRSSNPPGLKIDYGDEWLLELRDNSGFEFQCGVNDVTRWVPTTITASGHTMIFLDDSVCEDGETIRALRYAWVESPCVFQKCAVYSDVSGAPAPPFIAFAKDNDVMFTFDGPVHF